MSQGFVIRAFSYWQMSSLRLDCLNSTQNSIMWLLQSVISHCLNFGLFSCAKSVAADQQRRDRKGRALKWTTGYMPEDLHEPELASLRANRTRHLCLIASLCWVLNLGGGLV